MLTYARLVGGLLDGQTRKLGEIAAAITENKNPTLLPTTLEDALRFRDEFVAIAGAIDARLLSLQREGYESVKLAKLQLQASTDRIRNDWQKSYRIIENFLDPT